MKHISQDTLTEVRADIWLWAARMYKTRSVAKQAIDGGKVDVNGQGCKPSKVLHVGDR
ncbi:MAG TPA: S4 domain-containing protein, partial [Dyella sp.]|nr:S4 domain-containing protein [Dyella sp.]